MLSGVCPQLNTMKHYLTLTALLVSSAITAQISWPYNPDSDGNNLIAIEDLMSLLVEYNTDFYVEYSAPANSPMTLALIKGDESVITYTDCLRYCAQSGGHIITTTELALFESAIQSSPWKPSGSGISNGIPYENYIQRVYGYDDRDLGVGYQKQITVYPEGFDELAAGDTVWGTWQRVSIDGYFSTIYPIGRSGGDCYCSGVVENSNFGQ